MEPPVVSAQRLALVLRSRIHLVSADCREQLTELGIPFRHPVAKTGIVATIGSGAPEFALRTDIDALPILVRCLHAYYSNAAQSVQGAYLPVQRFTQGDAISPGPNQLFDLFHIDTYEKGLRGSDS